jgi:hypothetical protein
MRIKRYFYLIARLYNVRAGTTELIVILSSWCYPGALPEIAWSGQGAIKNFRSLSEDADSTRKIKKPKISPLLPPFLPSLKQVLHSSTSGCIVLSSDIADKSWVSTFRSTL